jgi:hypothetical protein
MNKKAISAVGLLTLTACLLTYKVSTSPVAFAKPRAPQESGAGVAPLPAPPAEWTISSSPGIGNAAVVTRAAGGAGVQHVADCIIATTYYQPGNTTTAGPNNQVLLQDIPVSGSQTYLAVWNIATPNSLYGMSSTSICGLNIVGSSDAQMKAFFTTSGTSIVESITLIGHDAT